MTTYDGATVDELARRIGVPRLVILESTPSTQDVAHALGADGAVGGTLVLADEQTAGRGRGGRRWSSPAGSGIWMTLLERPSEAAAVDVLSLRLGLRAAAVLDAFAEEPVRLKWPNDLYVRDCKLAGILVEARWREGAPDWVAIGIGLNVRTPDVPGAAGLRAGSERVAVLDALVPALRDAARARGPLTERELELFASRDLAAGRHCAAPLSGVVEGIDATGALRVRGDDGVVSLARGGSLVLTEAEAMR